MTARSYTRGTCEVAFEVINDKLTYLALTFTGAVAVIPSTSNTKAIYMNRQGRPFLGKNHKHKTRLNEMRDAYFIGLLNRNATPQQISFGKEQVHVMVLASHANDRTDSHNLSKGLCDWLEDVGIIENDKAAQCWCARATDYKRGETEKTLVVIRPFDAVRVYCTNAIINLTKMEGVRL